MEQPKKISPAIAAIIVIVLIGIAAATAVAMNNTPKASTPVTTSESAPAPASTKTSDSTNNGYKDGTYSATGDYSAPGGRESIELTVTLSDGVISSSTLVENAKSGEAKEYQAKFASGYKALVVGKKVGEVSLSRVAGSSLTSNGFNDALEQIKTDAAA